MKRFLQSFFYLLLLHVCGLLGLFIFRLTLFIQGHHLISTSLSHDYILQSVAFVRGLWFDNVVGCYISILPLTAIVAVLACGYSGKKLLRAITIYMQALFGLSFLISAANIPYFQYFFKNINSSIYNWFDYGFTTLGMVCGEPSYYFPIALFFIVTILYVWGTNRICHYYIKKNRRAECYQSMQWKERIIITITGLCLIGICVFGIRGRRGYNPIKVSAAYYCGDTFLNQLGVSPAFSLLASTLDDSSKENKYLLLMNEQTAIRNVQYLLGRKGDKSISPLYRVAYADTVMKKKPNVVFIIMESMSAHLLKTFGQKHNLTPFLDSLFHQSIAFSNFYSAGIHTNHGLYATFYSFPAIMKRNLMKGSVIPVYSGLPTVLHENGYHNIFFMTHEGQYDNMNAFFRTNGFDEIFSQENYPKNKVANSFGVQDDYLFQYGLNILNQRAKIHQPFMATLLTISNHPPYIIPSFFHPKSQTKEEQIVEYADWSVRQFFECAKKQPWFKNTIFVLEGDHGKLVGNAECEMPDSYNHIPLMIYSPSFKPQIKTCWATQIDIQPTLLGLLGINYKQNNFGINLLKEKRPCIFYTADNMIGARNHTHFYVYCPETKQEFFYLLTKDDRKVGGKPDKQFRFLKTYLFSMLQTAQYLVKKGKTVNHK